MIKKVAFFLAGVLITAALASCGVPADTVSDVESVPAVSSGAVSDEEPQSKPEPTLETADYSQKTCNIADELERIKVQGRYVIDGKGISIDSTGNGVEFTAFCEGDVTASLNVFVNSYAKTENFYTYYYEVWVDGEIVNDRASVTGAPGQKVSCDLPLASGLEKGLHTFALYRENENWLGKNSLMSITLNGELSVRPADKQYMIEFLGDSITAGYGNLWDYTQEKVDTQSQLWENGMKSFAFVAARELDTDFMCYASGGIKTDAVNDRYLLTSPVRSSDTRWTFDRKADIVVINLGTNDRGKINDDYTIDDFHAAVAALLKKTSVKNPDAKIVWAYGLMGEGKSEVIKEELEKAGGEAGGFYYYSMENGTDTAADAHPSVEDHSYAGKKLADYLRTLL